MREIAGAIVVAAGALLHGMTAQAEATARVAGRNLGSGDAGFILGWLLALVGLAVLIFDIKPALPRAKPPAPEQEPRPQ